MRGAASRIAVLVAVVVLVTAAISALVGLLAGASLARAVSVGFYLVGAFLIVLGFISGVRGPLRPKGRPEDAGPLGMFGVGIFSGGARVASGDERAEARAMAWLLFLLGLGLVLVGIVVDDRIALT